MCLGVVVDKENRTQIACQALVLRERTEDFVFIFECVAEVGKKHPKVTIVTGRTARLGQ